MVAKHDAASLTQEFWARRQAGSLSVKLTAKQAGWLQNLLHRMDRRMPYSHTYTLPTNGVPLSLVIYPNGAGFIKVEDFACEYDRAAKQWRVKPEYDR